MSAMGRQEWGAASASAACVVRGVSAVLSGRCTNALCLLENPGRHAPSGGYSVGHGCGVPKLKEGAKEGTICSVNSIAVGALYAHMQWWVVAGVCDGHRLNPSRGGAFYLAWWW